jgi:hypothetical protein
MSEATYKFVKEPGEKEKLAPQARVILAHIKSAGSAGIGRAKLLEHIEKELKSGELKESKQTAEKLVGFYQARLHEDGFIVFTKAVKEPKAPKEPKVKAEKAAPKAKTVADVKEAPKAVPAAPKVAAAV